MNNIHFRLKVVRRLHFGESHFRRIGSGEIELPEVPKAEVPKSLSVVDLRYISGSILTVRSRRRICATSGDLRQQTTSARTQSDNDKCQDEIDISGTCKSRI
jgi:hypothetical protein